MNNLPPIFNCSNDMALAANVRQYMPPKRIQQMEADLAPLADCWESGPWGWSLATKQRYRRMGIAEDVLPSDEWLANVRRLSSREFACGYIQELLKEINDERLVGQGMRYLSPALPSGEGALKFDSLMKSSVEGDFSAPSPCGEGWGGVERCIFKSPWSSSGRGVFVASEMTDSVRKRLQGCINSQGGFVVDTFYENKSLDFAMEFCVHGESDVEFLGYSVFHAADSGAYGYNLVASQEQLRQMIDIDDQLLEQLIDYHRQHLGRHGYTGPVGIDMLLCDDGRVHPCIEINLRMNMGILAINLWEKYHDEHLCMALTPQRAHGFQALVADGKLCIVFSD